MHVLIDINHCTDNEVYNKKEKKRDKVCHTCIIKSVSYSMSDEGSHSSVIQRPAIRGQSEPLNLANTPQYFGYRNNEAV